MTQNIVLCDACKKAIDEKNGSLSFTPLRGGLSFVAKNAAGQASMAITSEVNLCGLDCLTAWAEQTISAIKPTRTAPAATVPAAA